MSVIDLSQLPTPEVIETIDFETIKAECLADFTSRMADVDGFTALVESDPAYKQIEAWSYRETLIRQRINDAAVQAMLAYATKGNLDQLVAFFDITRNPGESDAALRLRAQGAPDAWSTAGPDAAYRYLALNADPDVRDVYPYSPAGGSVYLYVLSAVGNGTPDQALLDAVLASVGEDERPQDDQVSVFAAEIVSYSIDAVLTLYPGPDSDVVLANSRTSAQAYADAMHYLGKTITQSGLEKAIHVDGVQGVALNSPTPPIAVTPQQATYCTGINITYGGRGE